MTIVNITKQPLYGTVYWDGFKFVYTPNNSESNDNDFFLYTKTVDGATSSHVQQVNALNVAPTTNTIAITANASSDITFNVNDLSTDETKPFGFLKIKNVSGVSKGTVISDPENIYYKANYLNYVETFNYVVTDGEYDSTGTITVSVINGYVTPPKQLSFIELVQLGTNIINNLSSYVDKFNSFYNTLYDNKDSINSVNYLRYNDVSDNLLSSYNGLNLFYNNIDNYSSNYNTLQSNSSVWDATYTNTNELYLKFITSGVLLTDFLLKLNNERYNWDGAIYDTSEFISTQISDDFSTKIDSTYSTITANSGVWYSPEFFEILPRLSSFISLNEFLNEEISLDNPQSWSNLVSNAISLTAADERYTNLYGQLSAALDSINGNLLNDILYKYIPLFENYSDYINTSIDDIKINNLYNSATAISSSFYNIYQNVSSLLPFIQSNAANFVGIAFDILSSLSANYESAYAITNSLCDKWTDSVTNNIQNSYNTTQTNSGYWNILNDKLNLSSNIWENTHSTVTAYSPLINPDTNFLNKGSSYDAEYNNITVNRNLTSQNVSCFGVNTTISTVVFTLSSYDILNQSTDNIPAIYVKKTIPNSQSLLRFFVNENPVFYVNSDKTVNINLSSGGTKALNVLGSISASGYFYNIFNDQISKYKLLSSNYEVSYSATGTVSSTFNSLCAVSSQYTQISNFNSLSSSVVNKTLSAVPSYYSAYNNLTSLSAVNESFNNFITLCGPIFGIDNSYRQISAFYENFYDITTSIHNYV